jgi:hypothetical protein
MPSDSDSNSDSGFIDPATNQAASTSVTQSTSYNKGQNEPPVSKGIGELNDDPETMRKHGLNTETEDTDSDLQYAL